MAERNCYICKHRGLCYLRRAVEDILTKYGGIINFDSINATQEREDLFNSLANMCLEYKEQ